MNFELSCEIADLYAGDPGDWPLRLTVASEERFETNVVFELADAGRVTAFARVELDFPSETSVAFHDLADGRLPVDSTTQSSTEFEERQFDEFEPDGSIVPSRVPDWVLPPHVVSARVAARKPLEDAITRALGVIRWRMAVTGPSHSLSSFRERWSVDGDQWHAWYLPPLRLSLKAVDSPKGFAQTELDELLQAAGGEPLAHSILRDAREQAERFPNTALLLSVMAAELGMKSFIADRAPDAEWLAFEAPTPPLTKMIKHYLPTIDGDPHFRGHAARPTRQMRTILGNAVEMRNKVAHSRTHEPTDSALDEIMVASGDLLWLLDFARGYEWAIRHVSFETLHDLGILPRES